MSYAYEKDGIISRQRLNDIVKELFRKLIHMCSATVPLLLHIAYAPVVAGLGAVVALYCIFELMRLHGVQVPFVSSITAIAARKRDENRFVLGPVTLGIGILLAALLLSERAATIGILALAFGDGLASLAGKLFGQVHIPLTSGKTVAGSLTCFAAIFISSFLVCKSAGAALLFATAGMFLEVIPLKDFDNLLIPLVIGGLAQLVL